MPVVGQVHYDGKLDAWIGLHAVSDGNIDGPLVTDGFLCIGNNISAQPEWKVGKKKLFRLDEDGAAGWRHIDAKLVPIASDEGRDEYCLMERLCLEEEGEEEEEEEEEEATAESEEESEEEEEEESEEEASEEASEEEEAESEEMETTSQDECWDYGGRCIVRLTCFRVERDKDGEPMATASRLPRSYEVSRYSTHFDAQAFWM
jgi:hypothetical protein